MKQFYNVKVTRYQIVKAINNLQTTANFHFLYFCVYFLFFFAKSCRSFTQYNILFTETENLVLYFFFVKTIQFCSPNNVYNKKLLEH